MLSTGFLDQNVVKNPQFTPNAHQMSLGWGAGRGGGQIEVIFWDFRYDQLKVTPLPL